MWRAADMFSVIVHLLDDLRSAFTGLMLRLRGVDIGSGCRFGRKVKVARGAILGRGVSLQDGCEIHGRVRLGDRAVVQKYAEIVGNIDVGTETVIGSYSFVSTMPEAHIRIGARVLVNSFNVIGAGEQVVIEDDCIFAPYVQITDSTHRFEHIEDSPRHDSTISSPVVVGRGSWLGSGVKVLMGVQMGVGVVVGAGAVVNKSLPAMSVAVGMPAVVVRMRTAREQKETETA
jgi:acetyltransferase-like isoleucine patch superfamily enzyme